MDNEFGFVADDEKQDSNEFGFHLSPEDATAVANYISKPQQNTEMQSALRGAEQGLLFDHADELGGLMGSAMELPGKVSDAVSQGSLAPLSDENLLNTYREYRDFNRGRYKTAQEENPKSYLGGQFGGGALGAMAGGMALKGAGAAAGTVAGAEAAANADKAAQVANVAKKLSLGEKVGQGMKVGAGAGAVQASGTSEAPIMSGEFAHDVAVGTGVGTLAGGALPVGMATAGKAMDIAGVVASPVVKGFKQGMRNINLLGDEAEKSIQANIAKYGRGLGKEIEDSLNQLGKQKNELIKEAQANGIQVDPAKVDAFIESRLSKDVKSNLPEVQREMEQFREMLRTAKQGPMVEKDTRMFYGDGKTQLGKFEDLFVQKKMEQMLVPGSSSSVPLEVIYEQTDIPNKTMGIIRQPMYDEMGNFSGYKKIASKLMDSDEAAKFKDITENVRGGGRDLSKPEELYQLYKDLKQKSSYGDYSFKSQEASKQTGDAMKDVQTLLRESVGGLEQTDAKIASLKNGADVLGIEDTKNIDTQKIMNKVIDLVNQQENVGPTGSKAREKLVEFAQAIRAEHPELAKRVETQVKDMGEQAFMSKGISGLSDLGKANTYKRMAGAAGNVVGLGVYNLSKAPPERVRQVFSMAASKMGNTRAAQELSNIGEKFLAADQTRRNAILFGLMQNPAYKKLLEPEIGSEGGEEVK